MRSVRYEREREASQIQRSLKAWRKETGASGHGQAQIPQGGGAPLAGDVRAKMEPQLGADLSGVKVHTSGQSAQAATQLGARAFTTGSDVHFGAGEYAPGSKEGDRLLAHELTHAVQAQKSGVQRKAEPQEAAQKGDAGAHEVSQPGEPAEQEADAVGDRVADKLHGGGAKQTSAAGIDHEAGREQAKPIGAKLEGVGLKVYRMAQDDPRLKLAKKYNLNLQSPNSAQIVDNLGMTCEAFIAAFRKGSLKAEFPQEYLGLTVGQALDADQSKVRKLLIDGRFAK
jgi:hypothetical protein